MEKEINKWSIKYTYFTLLSMYTTSGGRRGSLISTCQQKKGHVQFKKWHTQMSPLPPEGLEKQWGQATTKQRRSNDDGEGNKKGKKNEAISELPLASVSKRG